MNTKLDFPDILWVNLSFASNNFTQISLTGGVVREIFKPPGFEEKLVVIFGHFKIVF